MSKPRVVEWDARSVSIDGVRSLMISGEVHYARVPRDSWGAILDRSVECGLNCIAAYVFWNIHEPEKDRYDFSGERDLGHFLRLCADRGLNVVLRAGPYCCAEWNYGGYPPYLRDEPGIVIRTWNEPYLKRVELYFDRLFEEILPFLATRGGPITMVQVENEYANVAKGYGSDGQRYLAWTATVAKRLCVDVPIIMCEGGADEAIETVNGFSMSAERLLDFRREHPDMPILWTELWPGWYDTWGYQEHKRDARNIAVHLLRFIALGGSGWNFYMWHAGTNFGRTSMYLQATRYGLDAPLDEHGRVTPKAKYLGELHRILTEHQAILLEGEVVSDAGQIADLATWRLGDRQLTIAVHGHSAEIRNESNEVLFDTEAAFAMISAAWQADIWAPVQELTLWDLRNEPFPQSRADAVVADQPIEQLTLTHDSTDYCWYSSSFTADSDGMQHIDIPSCADVLYIYVDEQLVSQTRPPFLENRGPTVPGVIASTGYSQQELSVDGFHQTHDFECVPGTHRLDILSASLGLVKGDWQIAGPMQTECKGIWRSVSINGRNVSGWSMYPALDGEKQPEANWACGTRETRPCTWYRTEFSLAPEALERDADYRLDCSGLGKGMLFVNGRGLGRHWLIEGKGASTDEAWQNLAGDGLSLGPAGEPTQRYYRVPREWLRDSNTLTIFEEQAIPSPRLVLETRLF